MRMPGAAEWKRSDEQNCHEDGVLSETEMVTRNHFLRVVFRIMRIA